MALKFGQLALEAGLVCFVGEVDFRDQGGPLELVRVDDPGSFPGDNG
jgi:hypothetical protein